MHVLRPGLVSDLKGGKLNFLSFSIGFKRTIKLSLSVHLLFHATQRELTERPASEPEHLAVFRDTVPQRNVPKTSSCLILHTTPEDNLPFCILLDPMVLVVSYLKKGEGMFPNAQGVRLWPGSGVICYWNITTAVTRKEGRCEHYRFPESEDISKQKINVNSNKQTLQPTQFCFLLIKGGNGLTTQPGLPWERLNLSSGETAHLTELVFPLPTGLWTRLW